MEKKLEKPRVLIVGCTGYIGRFITAASIRLGYPTHLLVRKDVGANVYKAATVINFKRDGAVILEGSLDDEDGLLAALKQVDVVISCLAEKLIPEQVKLVHAIRKAGTIQRFVPSEYGMDPAHLVPHALSPGESVFQAKLGIRKVIEEVGIPHTYVSANCFAGYFISGIAQFGQFFPPRDTAVVYGDGDVKVVWVDEDDIGTYVLKASEDPRTLNRSVFIRPPENILSFNEVLELWEKMTGKTLKKAGMSGEEFIRKINDETISFADRVALAHLYQIFIRGDLMFELGPDERDTAELYPEVKYTTVEAYLGRYI